MRKSFLLPISAALPTKKADLINHLWPRFLEIGKGLGLLGYQERIYFGKGPSVDIVYYHRGLRCIVPVMLGNGPVKPAQMEKMDTVLYYYANEYERPGSGNNPPIGIFVSRTKDGWLVDYYSYQDSVDFLDPDIEKELPNLDDLAALLG